MACGVYWQQIHTVDSALGKLRLHLDIPGISDAYVKLYRVRGDIMVRIGFKLPRIITKVLTIFGLSPGTLTLWFDVESGWMSEARARPGAPPIYKSVSDEVAITLLKGELTRELEAELMAPDEYLGE